MIHSNVGIGIMRFTLIDAVVGANPIESVAAGWLMLAGGAESGSG